MEGEAEISRSMATEKLVGLGILGRLMIFLPGVPLWALLSRYKPRLGVDLEAADDAGVKNLLSNPETRSFKLLRMSSSREFVASFRLIRSVALSLLRRLSWAISLCRLVAILVKLNIWEEIASKV